MLLPKISHRLRKTWEFQKVIKGRKKISNENFIIFFSKVVSFRNLKNQGPEEITKQICKLGISIPQRTVRKAVLRNKYKRQLKAIIAESIQENKNFLTRFVGYSLVLVVKDKFRNHSFVENKESLRKILGFLSWKTRNPGK